MARLSKTTGALLLLLALCALATAATTNPGGVSLRDACELKCTEKRDKASADCEEELGMSLDTSYITTCQTESAREAEYCVAGCSVLVNTMRTRSANHAYHHPTLLLLLATLALLLAASTAQLTFVANTTELLRETITDHGNGVAASPSNALRVGPGIAAALSIVGGLAVCFFGFRLMRPTMFLCGFVVGGFLCASAADVAFADKSYEATAWWIALIAGGIVVGALVLVLYSIGIFIVGAAGGVLLATVLNTSVGYKLFPNDPNTGLLVLAIVLGLLGGLLACKLEKPVIVLATSLVGAVLAVSGVGYFAKNFPDLTDLQTQFGTKDAASGTWSYDLPTVWWAYFASMLALFVLGAFVQFKKTSRGAGGRSRGDNAKMGGYSHA